MERSSNARLIMEGVVLHEIHNRQSRVLENQNAFQVEFPSSNRSIQRHDSMLDIKQQKENSIQVQPHDKSMLHLVNSFGAPVQ